MDWTIAVVVGTVIITVFALKRMAFIPAEAARKNLAAGALVIDVRTPEEFQSGHVPHALNIPLGDLGTEIPRRVKDKSQVLLVHCLSGGRSALAKQQLRSMGYLNTFNLGGYGRARGIVGKLSSG